MIVNRERIGQALIDLDGERALRNLLERELGYDAEDGLISVDGLAPRIAEEIAAGPTLIASTAKEGRFTVLYVRLVPTGKLSLITERKIMERLKKSYPYSLYIFSDAEDKLWHFVNAPLDPEAQAPGHLSGRKQYRRIVVGSPDHRNSGGFLRTAIERISLLSVDELVKNSGQVPEDLAPLAVHAAHDTAFDVEKVTKEFFREYRRVFESVEESIVGLKDQERRRYFVQRLFNRLMFVAFIENKGWMSLKGRADYLSALWKDYASQTGVNTGFYCSRLKPLFFRGFNAQDDGRNGGGREDPVIGVVPYLNGGLFEEDADDKDEGITVPDRYLNQIINGLFAGFNFTTTESTPLDVEVAVDPEMLGKVFEELVTGRHEVGAYYTPKEIVSFMCREALKGHLESRLEAATDDDREAIRTFVEEHDPAALYDPEAALGALREVRVCDPACGSGAYLLGMMRELLDLRESLFATSSIDPRTTYQRKLEIIANNVYGVDIDPFAVNIARLRLWLSLVVDYEGEIPPPLPNLDFRVEVGDSLLAPDPSGVSQTDLARGTEIEDFYRLKTQYLRAHDEEKKRLKIRIDEMRRRLSDWLHPGIDPEGFDWQVEFAEVFADNSNGSGCHSPAAGGFDVILANPPYVRQELIKHLKPELKKVFPEVYTGTSDLYIYFYARALQLLSAGGMLAFISSNKWFRANYGKKLRAHIARTAHVTSITDFGDLPVFESATAYPMIFTAQNNTAAAPSILTQVESLASPYPDVSTLVREQGKHLSSDAISGEDWSLTDVETATRVHKMCAAGIPLGEYVKKQIYYGIKTGFNKAFIINGEKREELISQDPKSAEIIKPFAAGRDIKRWRVEREKWLIVTPIGVEIDRYPAIFNHLGQWQPELERRYDKGNHWWELRACSYYDAFEKPKIVFPDIAKEPRFGFDSTTTYPGNTAYVIPVEDLYLLGVLNSIPVRNFYVELSSQVRGGYLRFIRQYVQQIPIPDVLTVDREVIVELVEKCLNARGVGCEEWEAEINERVAALYGLSGGS